MPTKPITTLPAILGSSTADEDLLTLVDVSEPDVTLKNKKITRAELAVAMIAAGIGYPAVADNVLVVSITNGNDSTGTRGRLDRPFKTPTGAQAVANSGDTIIVLPASHTLTAVLGKAGVNWRLEPGVTLTGASGLPVFAAGSAMTYFAFAHGATLVAGTGSATGAVNTDHASADVTVEGATITDGGNALPAAVNTLGTMTFRNCRISSASDSNTVTHAGTATKFDWCEVRNTSATGVTVSASGFTMQGGLVAVVGVNSFFSAGAQTIRIYGVVMVNAPKHANITVDGGGTITQNSGVV